MKTRITRQLSLQDWKCLRALVRHKCLSGHHLRWTFALCRRTKSGAWLTALVNEGLVRAIGPDPTVPQKSPEQHRLKYELTPLGRRAAEYGEYEIEVELQKSPSL